MTASTLEEAAARVAALLLGGGDDVRDPTLTSLEVEAELTLRPLPRGPVPADVWAVDGGQLLVADARCLQVVATRAARARFRHGGVDTEDEGELRVAVLGGARQRVEAVTALGVDGLPPDTSVDVNLLRDRWEWDVVGRCVDEAEPGGVVLLDGDLLPDWRLPASLVEEVLALAAVKGVLVAGVTKHSSLSRGGAPLVGQLEVEAASTLGPRATWWARVARTSAGAAVPRVDVLAARLDPDARFAFRVDLPEGTDAAGALALLSALSDDAAFPGYPYPLTVADRLAACPGWLRAEAASRLDDLLAGAGVPVEVRERAFTDRHRLMERA